MAAAGNLNPEEAVVSAITSGADMVLVWPGDLSRTHKAIISALEDGLLSRKRLLDAVQKIIYEKILAGIVDERQ
jgi:beta-glucosidase-like glycosyl hydrolase